MSNWMPLFGDTIFAIGSVAFVYSPVQRMPTGRDTRPVVVEDEVKDLP